MSKHNWMKLEVFRFAPAKVEDDVIRGCSIVTVGEALGHGVHLDESFVRECCEQANTMSLGLKARFGHPGMCNEALGTTLGRFKNFQMSSDGKQLFGDLYFAESARITPHGDLAAYVTQLAKDDPEAFGTSIVFQIGSHYRKDKDGNEVDVEFYGSREEYVDFEGDPEELSEELYVRCDKLMGCDFVDEPAANPGGLFSAITPAGQMAKFFKDNPEVEQLLLDNKNVVDIIEKYGVNIKEFLGKEIDMKEKENSTEEEVLDLNSDNSHQNCDESQDVESFESEQLIEEVSEEIAEIEEPVEEEPEVAQDEPEPVEAMSASQFRDLVQEFGAEIATKIFDRNGSREDALALRVAELTEHNATLFGKLKEAQDRINELKKENEEYASEGVAFSQEVPKKRDIIGGLKL